MKIVGICDQPLSVLKSEPVSFQLRNVTGQHIFLLVKLAFIQLIRRDFLETHDSCISFSKKGEMHLQLSKSDTEPIGKIMIFKKPPQEETNLEID